MSYPPLEGVLELARGGVDVLHHPQGLLELADGALELAVEDPAVGDHHDGIEDAPVVRIVQGGEPVGEPRDGEALAAPRRVLDEVALPRSPPPRIEDEAAHAVELLVAGEDEEAPTGLAAVLVLFLDLVDELANEIEHAVARPGLVPEIAGGVATPGRGHGGIAGPAEPAPVEGKEARLAAGEVGGDVDQLRVDREVRETPAVGEERLAHVAVGLVLSDRVLDGLAGQRILELGREDGYAVEEEHEIEAPLVPGAVPNLSDDREKVRPVEPPRFLVEAARGAKVREPERAAHVLEAAPEDIKSAAPLNLGREALQEPLPHRSTVMLREPLPFLRLGGLHEVEDIARQEAKFSVVVLRPAPPVTPGAHVRVTVGRRHLGDRPRNSRDLIRPMAKQSRLDGILERTFGDLGAHATPPLAAPNAPLLRPAA